MRRTALLILLLILAGCGTDAAPTTQPGQPTPHIMGNPATPEADAPAQPTATLQATEPSSPAPTDAAGEPTKAPVVTEAYVPDVPVPAIVTLSDDWALILGGSQGDRWLTAPDISNEIPFADPYQLVTFDGLGPVLPPGPIKPNEPICPDFWTVTVPEQPQRTVGVAGAGWELLPRPIEQLSPDAQEYNEALVALLEEQGIGSPTAAISQLLRVDLDGDGTDEVLMSATFLKEGTSLPTANVGDYTLVAMRKLVGGEVKTQLLVSEFYLENVDFIRSTIHTIPGIADLNGDGTMEIVVYSAHFEGNDARVFSLEGDEMREVLLTGCGL